MKMILVGIMLLFPVFCFAQTAATLYQIQVGAFREAANAEKAVNNLRSAGVNAVSENHMGLTRVRVSGVNARQLPVLLNTLRGFGYSDPWVRSETRVSRVRVRMEESPTLYRMQIGAFIDPVNANNVFEKLINAGLSPAYEYHGSFYRVVLPMLREHDIPSTKQTLENLGFQKTIVRAEN